MCISDNTYADSDSKLYARFSYLATGGWDVVTDYVRLDNSNCNDLVIGHCDYFDVVPADIEKLYHVDMWLDGDDGF